MILFLQKAQGELNLKQRAWLANKIWIFWKNSGRHFYILFQLEWQQIWGGEKKWSACSEQMWRCWWFQPLKRLKNRNKMTRRDPKNKCHFRASQVSSSSAGPISISFLNLLCQRTEIKSHDQSNKAKKWKRIASLVSSSVQSSNFLLFCSSPPRLLFPKQSAISSAKGKRVAKISKSPCIQDGWGWMGQGEYRGLKQH